MDFVEQLKTNVDIVRVVGEYVRLRRAGSGPRWTGLCPFHTEKTASFSVHGVHQFYKCFGCGVGGDVIQFVMEIESLSFWEALKLLAERNGIPLPQRSGYADAEGKLREGLVQMHETALRLYRAALDSSAGAQARAYLERRGVSAEIAQEFGLGFAERSGQLLARRFAQDGCSEEMMEASGLVLKRSEGGGFFDRFRGRLMFPIHGESGKIIGFAGRALAAEDEPKYLNSPETPVYRKSQVLYNLHRARQTIRKSDSAILVEGYMDVIGLHAAGVGQAVASCGTALTNGQVRMLRRHSENLVVNFDPDAAGSNAAERSIQMLLEEGMHIRVLELEEGLDPDEYVKRHGGDGYRARLEKAERYFHWLADRARKRHDMHSAEGRVAGLKFLLPAIQRIPDKLERAAVASDVAGYLGVDRGLVLDEFRKAASERRSAPLRQPKAELPAGERILLRCLLESEAARREILPRLASLASLDRLASRNLLRALVAVGERFSYAALEARLEESEKTLLASLVFADEMGEETVTVEQALACLGELEVADRESERSALKLRIRAAERGGDLPEALRLNQELMRMDRG